MTQQMYLACKAIEWVYCNAPTVYADDVCDDCTHWVGQLGKV